MLTIRKLRLNQDVMHSIVTAAIVKPLHVEATPEDVCLWAVIDTAKQPEEWVVAKGCDGFGLDNEYLKFSVDDYVNSSCVAGYNTCHWFCRKLVQSTDM